MKYDSRFIVYNLYDFNKRQLNLDNYDDDVEAGLLFFSRKAMKEIINEYCVIGFCMYDRKTLIEIPIDFIDDKISIFEGPFNCMEHRLKEALLKYNIETNPPYFTDFMKRWQFLCDFNCFNINSYVALSYYVIKTPSLFKKCIDNNLNIFFPYDYEELCNVVRNIIRLFDLDYMNMDFVSEYKQLLYSLENNILINFNDTDIYVYFENFCKIVLYHKGKEK